MADETPKRGEAAWRAQRDAIASRNEQASKRARARRQRSTRSRPRGASPRNGASAPSSPSASRRAGLDAVNLRRSPAVPRGASRPASRLTGEGMYQNGISPPPGDMTTIAQPQRNGDARRFLRRRPAAVNVQREPTARRHPVPRLRPRGRDGARSGRSAFQDVVLAFFFGREDADGEDRSSGHRRTARSCATTSACSSATSRPSTGASDAHISPATASRPRYYVQRRDRGRARARRAVLGADPGDPARAGPRLPSVAPARAYDRRLCQRMIFA